MNMKIPTFLWLCFNCFILATFISCLLVAMPIQQLKTAAKTLALVWVGGSILCWTVSTWPPVAAVPLLFLLAGALGWWLHRGRK